MRIYNVQPGQNLFDVSLTLYGSVEGMFHLLAMNPELSYETRLKAGDELVYDEEAVMHNWVVDAMRAERLVPANGERHVYPKVYAEEPYALVQLTGDAHTFSLDVAGEGVMVVDWGDNSVLESVHLTPTLAKHLHYFDSRVADGRCVKLYGDFSLKRWELVGIRGELKLLRPLTVNEVSCRGCVFSLEWLRLCQNTYAVSLADMSVRSLSAIEGQSLSDLTLTNIHYPNPQTLDEYLIYLATHYGERRACRVVLDTRPSGDYREPPKGADGRYVIRTGMEAVHVITHEAAWNEAAPWEFDIIRQVYRGNEQ